MGSRREILLGIAIDQRILGLGIYYQHPSEAVQVCSGNSLPLYFSACRTAPQNQGAEQR